MQIQDRVYGKFNIEEPVLLELINSKPVQRLKGINQAGASQYALDKKNVTRYEHSLGVMILLKILGASLEEQIAGLLHDVPHTAFSHVIDYVFDDKDHEFHERFHEKMIKNSEIPEILKKHDFDLDRILDEHNFPILEKKLPDLCADRIDYALRDRLAMGEDGSRRQDYISNLVVQDSEIIFKDRELARQFAEDFLHMDYGYWSHPMEIALFQVLADAIKLAMEKKIVSEDDLFQDDDFVFNKLKKSGDEEIIALINKLRPGFDIKTDKNDYDFYSKNKLRFVNPKFIDADGSTKKVADVFFEFKRELNKHESWVTDGHYIKVLV